MLSTKTAALGRGTPHQVALPKKSNTKIVPKKIATQVLKFTCSLNIIADKATTITGVKDPILWASANVKYRKDKTKHPDSIIDNILLVICNFKLLVL